MPRLLVQRDVTHDDRVQEHILNSAPASKPLLLFHLLLDLHVAHALCFTKSIEAATRLVKLVELFLAAQVRLHPTDAPALRVASYSSDLPVAKRTKLLEAFKSGDIHLCVPSTDSYQ
jgi:ATP-dependent RNA helicase DDX51/DBP6